MLIYASTPQGKRIASIGASSLLGLFKRQAKWYDARLTRYLPLNRQAKCVDVPCGEGNILYFLKSKHFENAIGYEIDACRVEIARELGLNAIQGDAFEVIRDLESIDVFFCVDFIEHISKDDAIEFLLNIARTLKPGGLLLLRTPVTDSPSGGIHLYNDFTHKWAVNSNVWQTISAATGFDLIATIDERPTWDSVKHAIGRIAFEIGRTIYKLYLRILILPVPTAWSPSAWFVMRKRSEST